MLCHCDFDYVHAGGPGPPVGLVLGIVLGVGGCLVTVVVAAIAIARLRAKNAYRGRGEEWLKHGVSTQFLSLSHSDIRIYSLPNGSPWILGSGAYGQVRTF